MDPDFGRSGNGRRRYPRSRYSSIFYFGLLVVSPWRPGARNTIHSLDPATVSNLCLMLVCLSHHGGSSKDRFSVYMARVADIAELVLPAPGRAEFGIRDELSHRHRLLPATPDEGERFQKEKNNFIAL
jgi:hypothetical protein